VADIDVSAVPARRRRVEPPLLGRRDAHHTAERLERDRDAVVEDAGAAVEGVVMDVRLQEVVGSRPLPGITVSSPALVLERE